MISAILNFPYSLLFRDALWGVIGLIFILVFHGFSINHVYMRFERLTLENLRLTQFHRVFLHFYIAFVFIALIHLLEILFWTLFMVSFGLFNDPIHSLLFAGSCYTTVGFATDDLPNGWKSLAFFISFSGLFSLAWTTSIMIGMTATYKSAWNQKFKHQVINQTKQ